MEKINYNNKLLKQLPYVGLIYFFSGLFVSIILFPSQYYNGTYVSLLSFSGAILGYIGSFYIERGGAVNFYLNVHKDTKDEKELFKLIAKYRSGFLMKVVTFIYIISIFILNSDSGEPAFDFNTLFFILFWSAVSILGLCNGVKFISAWWNVRRVKQGKKQYK